MTKTRHDMKTVKVLPASGYHNTTYLHPGMGGHWIIILPCDIPHLNL